MDPAERLQAQHGMNQHGMNHEQPSGETDPAADVVADLRPEAAGGDMPPLPERPIPLLLNPHAGSLFRSGLRKWLLAHDGYFRLITSDSPEQMQGQAHDLAEKGEPVIAAAGGDGTLKTAARGLLGSRSALGILPSGTMNVFARELGIGSRRFDLALRAMLSPRREEVDLFTINGEPFLQMAGFGLDARIVQLITPGMKRLFGAASHIFTALRVATEHHAVITLTLPGGEEIIGTQLILGNGKRYGGEARLFARASYNDGKLDAVMIQQESMGILMEIIASMMQHGGTNRNSSQSAQFCQLAEGVITAESKLAYQLDGDYAGTLRPTEEAVISRLPDTLRICVPEHPVPVTAIGRLMAHPAVTALRQRLARLREL